LYKEMGGTNTPFRRNWLEQLSRGRREGWYRVMIGEITSMKPVGELVEVALNTDQGPQIGTVDFVLDCTGLEADIREHRVLADLLDHSGVDATPSAGWTSSARSSSAGRRTAARSTPSAAPRSVATSRASTPSTASRSPAWKS